MTAVYCSDWFAGVVLKVAEDQEEAAISANLSGPHQQTDAPIPVEVALTGQSLQTLYLETQNMGITLRQWLTDQSDMPGLGQILEDFVPFYVGCIAIAATSYRVRDLGTANIVVEMTNGVLKMRFIDSASWIPSTAWCQVPHQKSMPRSTKTDLPAHSSAVSVHPVMLRSGL